jgi:hypothetical protein
MSMQSPVNATPIRTYPPLGKVPVVSLTQDLPPGLNADCLLLECGDARNILYTFFCEENNGIFRLYEVSNSRPSSEMGYYLF